MSSRYSLDLLRDLQRDLGTAIILITHDMGVVAEMADRVIVTQQGRQVETAATTEIFARPQADYTRSLLAAVPRMGQATNRAPATSDPIARLTDVVVRYPLRGGLFGGVTQNVHAVEHVSFDVRKGETFALVGESGCGKSTIAKALVGLAPHQGRIEIAGQALDGLDSAGLKWMPRRVQMVFQDPMAALNPRMRIGDLISEPLAIHGIGSPAQQTAHAADLMTRVGLLEEGQLDRYPHEFSGGQRQPFCIARALALKPDLIIADESVSALDVSVQARVLELLRDLQREFGMSYLFISHDMAVVNNVSDHVGVMYLGQIVGLGTTAQIFGNPQHPYTRSLIEAVPIPDPSRPRNSTPRRALDLPSPLHLPGQAPQRVSLVDKGYGHLVAS